jgi:hypothetical protein
VSTLPVGACVRHPDEPAAFRCRHCRDTLCRACRAPGERELCTLCIEYFARAEEIERQGGPEAIEAAAARRRARVRAWVIAGSVVVNVVLGATLVYQRGQPVPAEVTQMFADVAAIARVVETVRAAAGRPPASLQEIADRLPPSAAELVRRGVVRYEPDQSGAFTVSIVQPAAPVVR